MKKDSQKKADIKVGFSCNNNCLFCVQAHKKNYGDKTTREVDEDLKAARRRGCQTVVFTGGEPTVRRDFLKLVQHAKRLGFKTIQIQSNGRMFSYRDFCAEAIESGANEFALALHGHISELHDFLTSAKGSFDQTCQGIKNLKNLKQRVITNTVIVKSNYRHLSEIADLLISLKVDQYQLAFVHAMGNAMKNFAAVVPRKTMVHPYVKEALRRGISAGVEVMVEAMPFCFLRGFERYVAEVVMPEMKIFDWNKQVLEDFEQSRRQDSKIKGPLCHACRYFKKCEGPWKEYPEKFGWSEFKPILKK
jgi:MoaA/NifB/PqqE/SkfB family radical SAM enzyme